MTFDHKEALALVERLDALATKATPMDLGAAEIVQDEGYFECAMCNGNGETWGNGYLNIDGIALNVQFSGIGSEFKDNERFVMALIEAYRSGALTAALDEIAILRTEKHADAEAIAALQAERDRQYDQNVEQIVRMASMELERDALRDALTLIERLYYIEDKDAEWRASRMNGVAREAQDGNDLGHYRRIFPRAALSTDTKVE